MSDKNDAISISVKFNLNEAEDWIAQHEAFWEDALQRLDNNLGNEKVHEFLP